MGPDRTGLAVRRFTLVTLVLPAIVTTVGLSIQLAVLRHAPRRIAVHWNSSGTPSVFGPVWLPLALTVALGLALPSLVGVSSLPRLRRGDRSPTYRIFGSQALGISVMQNVFATGLLLRSLGDTSSGESRAWLLLVIGLAAGIAAAVSGWLLQPRVSGVAAYHAVAPLKLAPNERAAWMHTTFLPAPAVAMMSVVASGVALRAAFGWASGDRPVLAVILTAVALLLFSLLATTAAFQVRVDARGLIVRSLVGVPRFRVGTEQVGSVAVLEARSLGLAGSWGIRARPGRVTVVMGSPTGISVRRRDGGTLFVTVSDAATGAALLKALASRREGVAAGLSRQEDAGND